MKHLKRIFESRLTKEQVRDYFLEFMDRFNYIELIVGEDEPNVYELFIAMEERYWYKNRQEVSECLNDCINHLISSTGLSKSISDNYYKNFHGEGCRIIKKRFILR